MAENYQLNVKIAIYEIGKKADRNFRMILSSVSESNNVIR